MMGSSRALGTMQMVSRGLKYEPGTIEDTFCRIALEGERRIEYLKTLVVVNAIIGAGNNIAAAVTGSAGSKDDSIKKLMESLRKLLLPEEAERTEKEAGRAERILKAEAEGGPIKFRTVSQNKPKKGRVKLKV